MGQSGMNPSLREYFDKQLEHVIAELPQRVRDLLHDVPVIVDDHPTPKMMRRLGARRRDEICGLYTGVPITEKSVADSGRPPDVIHLFRAGIIAESQKRSGELSERALRRNIRLTILHEFGHHHGLDEDELEELGY